MSAGAASKRAAVQTSSESATGSPSRRHSRLRRPRPPQDGAALNAEDAWVLEPHPGISQRTRSCSRSPGNQSWTFSRWFSIPLGPSRLPSLPPSVCFSLPVPSGEYTVICLLKSTRVRLPFYLQRGDVARVRDDVTRPRGRGARPPAHWDCPPSLGPTAS